MRERAGAAMQREDQRLERAIAYVQRHLDADLSMTRLASVAGISKHYFQRRFAARIGVGAAKFIQLLRLKRASFRLVFDIRSSITDIAFDAGFANAESFTRAFGKTFGQSPRAFRNRPAWQRWRLRYRVLMHIGVAMSQVEIIQFEATLVAVVRHRESPLTIYDSTRKLIEWRRANGVTPGSAHTFGIHYPDQSIDLCVSYEKEVVPNPQGVVSGVIPSVRCARLRHLGSREHIAAAEYLLREWLPGSGETLGDFPMFFHYVNVGPDVQDNQMITDVYLPLRP
jgi:AraC family transcriptional regulator